MADTATIIVPVDGATNCKLEVIDVWTFETLHSVSTPTPVTELNGLQYNCTGEQFAWYDRMIRELPDRLKRVAVIAPVARGCSGGLVGADDSLIEEPGSDLTLAYTHRYPERVEERFREIAGSDGEFFRETGSILGFPGGLTLLKRFLFEEMERSELLAHATAFGSLNCLMSGHFLGSYHAAISNAGNEHGYWMCHTGARDITAPPGMPSTAARKIASFLRLLPAVPSVVYRTIGAMPGDRAVSLGLASSPPVIPGGHDTCLSHIPVMSSFTAAFPEHGNRPVIHVDAGSWTMIARVGGTVTLDPDGWCRDILVQGTVDGEPVITARYGGGNDYREIAVQSEDRGLSLISTDNEAVLFDCVSAPDVFLLPNISPVNHGTGPFPHVRGRIIGADAFFRDSRCAAIYTTLTTAAMTAEQIEAVADESDTPVVLTAGGAKDPLFGRLLATFTGRAVYALFDRVGHPVTETTTLGAAIAGRAALDGVHPYEIDVSPLGIRYRTLPLFTGKLAQRIGDYRSRLLKYIGDENGTAR